MKITHTTRFFGGYAFKTVFVHGPNSLLFSQGALCSPIKGPYTLIANKKSSSKTAVAGFALRFWRV